MLGIWVIPKVTCSLTLVRRVARSLTPTTHVVFGFVGILNFASDAINYHDCHMSPQHYTA